MTFNPASISTKKYNQGIYENVNPNKYISNHSPIYRSSWEKDFMISCDINPMVISWGIEPFSIKYMCPKDQKLKNYWVDFYVKYMDNKGIIHEQLVEIKPYKQTRLDLARTQRDKLIVYINYAKWSATIEFCKQNNYEFKLLTERELYNNGKKY